MDDVVIAAEPVDGPDARALLAAYLGEITGSFGVAIAPDPDGAAAGLAPPTGRFLVVRLDGRPVGCGGVRTVAPGVGEVKRMWLDPSCRGRGLGHRLLATVEGVAAELGHRELRLDTHGALVPALALYRAAGYREVPPYNDNPDATHWFAREL